MITSIVSPSVTTETVPVFVRAVNLGSDIVPPFQHFVVGAVSSCKADMIAYFGDAALTKSFVDDDKLP